MSTAPTFDALKMSPLTNTARDVMVSILLEVVEQC